MGRIAVRVQGGTGAGVREPLRDRPGDWRCVCGATNRGRWARCLTVGCNAKRPR